MSNDFETVFFSIVLFNCITTWFGSAWLLKVICNALASSITLVTSRELVRPAAPALFRC